MKKMLSKLQMFAISALILGVSVPLSINATSSFDKIEHEIKKCCRCLSEKIEQLAPCSKPRPIYQKDIDKAYATCQPFTITEEGYYYLAEDISFDIGLFSSSCTNLSPFIGAAAINIQAPNVDLDFCNHTLTINGALATGVAVFSAQNGGQLGSTPQLGAARTRIHGGTIQGPTVNTLAGANGIFIYSNGTTVTDMQIMNLVGSEVISPSFEVPVSTGIAIQTANVASSTAPNIFYNPGAGVLIEKCTFIGNGTAIDVENWGDNVIIRDVSIDRGSTYLASSTSTPPTYATTLPNLSHHGILFVAGFGEAPNVLLENVQIANMGVNGIWSGLTPNANYILKNVQVGDSGLNGMVLSHFRNLQLSNCQVYNSGAYGIVASLDYAHNLLIEDTQIENAGQGEVLRIFNVENVKLENVQAINYVPSYYNPAAPGNGTYPVVAIQDVRNGLALNCLFSSRNGTSDAVLIDKSSHVTFDNCSVQVATLYPPIESAPNPTGFNIAGGNYDVEVKDSSVSGSPWDGIRVGADALSLYPINYGVVLQGNKVEGANSNAIEIDATSDYTVIEDNKVANSGTGINDAGVKTVTQHNLAVNNTTPYSATVPLQHTYPLPATASWYVNVYES